MGLCRLCCCCGLFSSLAVALAVLALKSCIPPRTFVQDACKNVQSDDIRVVNGFPFRCGWQQVRPEGFGGSSYVPYAFIQPNGSWCWSNSGFIGRAGSSAADGLLIDTLTDPVLTSGMLSGLGKLGANQVGALIFTHPDGDQFFGNQAVPPEVPRLGTKEAQKEVTAQKESGLVQSLLVALSVGHFIWEAALLVGPSSLFAAAPQALQEPLLKVLGWARTQTFMTQFSFADIDVERLPKFSTFLDSGSSVSVGGATLPLTFKHFGPMHSKSDSVLLLPESKVAFAGDLLFLGIAPVMWAGPAKVWIAALDELLGMTGEDWLFVPGHGPVTDAEGVRSVRRFIEYVDRGVSSLCADLPLADEALDEVCAERVFDGMPSDLRREFKEPQRIMICAAIERLARRAGGPAPIELKHKVKYMAKMGEHLVREAYLAAGSSGRHPAAGAGGGAGAEL